MVDNGGLGPNGLPVGPTDQRSKIRTFNIAPVWTRLINANSVFTLGGFVRQDQYNYYPSDNPFADFTPDLQSTTAGQNRRLTNAGARTSLSYVKGIHNIKIGATYEHTFLTERDSFRPGRSDGQRPLSECRRKSRHRPHADEPERLHRAALQSESELSSASCLLRPDQNSAAARFRRLPEPTSSDYTDTTAMPISRNSRFYVQDTITLNNWTFNLGVRFDKYNGLASAAQGEPRLGIAYNIKPTNTVLRVSYARTMETPFNENLVLASLGCHDPVIVAFQAIVGGALRDDTPLSPGHRNEFHAGLSAGVRQVSRGRWRIHLEVHPQGFRLQRAGQHADHLSHRVGELEDSRLCDSRHRAELPWTYGVCGDVQRGGALLRPAGRRYRRDSRRDQRIPHRPRREFNQTTHLQYQPSKKGPWFSFNWRYDSGLVAGPVPCAGGNCANGPNGTDSIVDVSGLTPGSTVRRRTLLRERSCHSHHADQSERPLPGVACTARRSFDSRSWHGKRRPQPAAHRIAQSVRCRVGDDNIFQGDKYKWSARLTVVNLTNKEALYNFLSTFSGTHYVSPRAITATIGFHF